MSIQQARELINQGHLNDASKLINSLESEQVEKTYLAAQILYHQGRIKDALELIDTSNHNSLSSIQNFRTYLRISLGEQIKVNTNLVGVDYYSFMSQGIVAERSGDYANAVEMFEKSTNYSKSPLDLGISYYKIANSMQSQGYIQQAIEKLRLSLTYFMKTDLTDQKAAIYTLLGQNYLLSYELEKGIDSLLKGISNWEELNSPFGLAWALGELAITYLLRGQTDLGLNSLIRLYEILKSRSSAENLSYHLLNIILFSLKLRKTEILDKYMKEFKILNNSHEENHIIINSRYKYVESVVKLSNKRLSKVLSALSEFETLDSYSEYFIKVDSIINQLKVLMLEFKITQDKIIKSEVENEMQELHQVLLNYMQRNQNVTLELHSGILRSEISILNHNPHQAQDLIQTLLSKFEENDIKFYQNLLLEVENSPEIEWKLPHTLDKDLHSIPKLKIILYLLPRLQVSFSELQKATELSSGNLSGQCKKLEELEFIDKIKGFIDEKPVTLYRLTPLGFQAFQNYASQITEYLSKVMKMEFER